MTLIKLGDKWRIEKFDFPIIWATSALHGDSPFERDCPAHCSEVEKVYLKGDKVR